MPDVRLVNQAMNRSEIPAGPRFVLVCILSHIPNNDPSAPAYPSIKRICEMTGISRRSVISHIKYLEHYRHLFIRRSRDEHGHQSVNRYYFIPSATIAPSGAGDGATSAPGGVQITAVDGASWVQPTAFDGATVAPELQENYKMELKGTINRAWVETIDQTAEFCGGESLSDAHIESIEEKGKSLNLEDEALLFQDYHQNQHRAKPYKKFATFMRFSSTWLNNSLKEPQYGHDVARRNGRTPRRHSGKSYKRQPSGDFSKELAAQNAQEAARIAALGNDDG